MTAQKFYFNKRHAALGTKHKKEKVITPLFQQELGILVRVPYDYETDQFGTFSLDKPRSSNQKNTARLKARGAMELLGLDIGIASEGTFGPHPQLPFGIANTEIVIFVDDKYGLEVFGGSVEPVTYAQNIVAHSIDEVIGFANNIGFPLHGIVIRKAEKNYKDMVKGIINKEELTEVASRLLQKNKSIWLETDFRAHVNHSRMQNIRRAVEDLISNLKRHCPKCDMPGFHRITSKPGLPCESCGHPTDMPLYDVYKCDKCDFEQDLIFPNDKEIAYAGYCDYCNP